MKKLHLNIANNLKDIRKNEKGWHQDVMADFLGVSKKYYNQIENGKANLTLNKIEEMAEKLEKESPSITGGVGTHVFNNISHNQQGGETKIENIEGTDKEIISYLLAQNQILVTQNQTLATQNQEQATYIKELMQLFLNKEKVQN